MALTRTLEQLREAVRHAADVVAFTDRHSDAYVNDLVNRGLGALNRLTAVVAPGFRPLASTTLTTDGVATMYALPSNFRSLISVEYEMDGSRWWMTPYETHERAGLASPDEQAQATRARHYAVIGDNIELLPRPVAGHRVFLWYATTAPQLAGDADAVDVMDRLDDFVIWWAAREIASERGDWERHGALSQRLAEVQADIQVLARQRDVSVPHRLVREQRFSRYGRRLR
jgi:hypothetical protein